MRTFAAIAFGLLLFVAGCDQKSVEQTEPMRRIEMGDGIVRGKVTFTGNAPEMNSTPGQPCGDHTITVVDQSLIVAKDGGVKNAFVYIDGVSAGDGAKRDAAMLDQKECQYVPHAVAVQVGQTLKIHSSDNTLHNVHYQPQANPAANLSMTRAGQSNDVTFKNPEFIHVRCDVHPWMNATIGVFASPFFAITDDEGNFELKGLPPGKYKLSAWHERLGELSQEITIGKQPVTATVIYGK